MSESIFVRPMAGTDIAAGARLHQLGYDLTLVAWTITSLACRGRDGHRGGLVRPAAPRMPQPEWHLRSHWQSRHNVGAFPRLCRISAPTQWTSRRPDRCLGVCSSKSARSTMQMSWMIRS